MRRSITLVILLLAASACTADDQPAETSATPTITETLESDSTLRPDVPDGPLTEAVSADLDALFGTVGTEIDNDAIRRIGASGDVRLAWLMSDLLRFLGPGGSQDVVREAFSQLTGLSVSEFNPWGESVDLLLARDLAEPPRYRELKGLLFTAIDDRWAPFFAAGDSEIDYRILNWGGVRPDDRPYGDFEATCRGGCIPALDNPGVTDAEGGDWYSDDSIVFGVAFNGEARAYPKNMMEVHEMVLDTVGGVRFGMPYCTLCGSAQAYDLESVPQGVEPPVLRTSGLLSRSNKVMYDLNTYSVFDTFTGRAVSGPLLAAGVALDQLTVVTATWGAWKEAHPETTILARDGGIGRAYPIDPLQGRDDDGPIFPIGPVDRRLPVQESVLGVETPDGTFVAFPAAAARAALDAGSFVERRGVIVIGDADGLRAELEDGTALVSHQAFWFAWSQFHPDTDLWSDTGL